MKKINKTYIRGSSYPVYIGNGIISQDKKKVSKFIMPTSYEINKILKK